MGNTERFERASGVNIEKSQIRLGAIINYLAIGFSIIAGLLYTPWMIKQIGQSNYGIYTLANSVITLFVVDFGLGAATSRFVARYRATGDESGLQCFLCALYKLFLLIDLFVFIILCIVYINLQTIYGNLLIDELERLRVVYCIVGLYSIISFPCITFNGVLYAFEKIIPLKLADLMQKVGSVVFTIIALSLGYGLYSLVIVNAGCGILSITIKYCYVKKTVSFRLVRAPRRMYKEILAFSLWTTVSSLSQRLVFNISPTIIGITVSGATSAIAIFGIISTIEGYVYTITTALNGMFIGRIASILAGENVEGKLTTLTIKIGRFQYLLNGLIVLGVFFIGKDFIVMWMGEEFTQAYYGTLLVVFPGLFYNPMQIANSAMIAENYVKQLAIINVFVGVCNVCLSFVFSSIFGVLGAALSIFVAYSLRTVLTIYTIKKKLKIDIKLFFKIVYLRMSVPILITIAISFVFIVSFEADSWFLVLIKAAITTLVYLLCVFVFGTYREEKHMITKKLLGYIKNTV